LASAAVIWDGEGNIGGSLGRRKRTLLKRYPALGRITATHSCESLRN